MARRRPGEPAPEECPAIREIALRGYVYRLAGPEAYEVRYGPLCEHVTAEVAARDAQHRERSRYGAA